MVAGPAMGCARLPPPNPRGSGSPVQVGGRDSGGCASPQGLGPPCGGPERPP